MFEKSLISDLNSAPNVLDLTQAKKSVIAGIFMPDIALPILLSPKTPRVFSTPVLRLLLNQQDVLHHQGVLVYINLKCLGNT